MSFLGLKDFISRLEADNDLVRVREFVSPELEMTEITDRVVKNGGKALLFEDNGTRFPVLMNAFGSEKRIAEALGMKSLDEASDELSNVFSHLATGRKGFLNKLGSIPQLIKLSGYMPSRGNGKGLCQQVVYSDPDLNILPVLKCWPYDGGRFITLPIVHTRHPDSGAVNAGMYRMQVLDRRTTAMHWHRHKTGANHYEAWKRKGGKMPVTVVLGGDPVYTWSATAPLPENVDEYILAGFLRKKKVKMVRCLTNDLWVPYDADIVIEGYVDPSEELVSEGPFGDHTGFYSVAGFYPKFHVTCITHSLKAVYPATIVGIPPQEDAYFTKAAEKIFLAPIKMALQPEITDMHMPDAGVTHNLVIVKIDKSYPGQGRKVIGSLLGAGQMMFTKYLAVVSGDVDIRNYPGLAGHLLANTDFRKDLMFLTGPLDVLDHSSETDVYGGKLGIDATRKLPEESQADIQHSGERAGEQEPDLHAINAEIPFAERMVWLKDYKVIIIGIDPKKNPEGVKQAATILKMKNLHGGARLILATDHKTDPADLFMVLWQVLGNTDPQRDIEYISGKTLLIDGTIKAFREGGFPRKWPNPVCSSTETIKSIDERWDSFGIGPFIPSPSLRFSELAYRGADFIEL